MCLDPSVLTKNHKNNRRVVVRKGQVWTRLGDEYTVLSTTLNKAKVSFYKFDYFGGSKTVTKEVMKSFLKEGHLISEG